VSESSESPVPDPVSGNPDTNGGAAQSTRPSVAAGSGDADPGAAETAEPAEPAVEAAESDPLAEAKAETSRVRDQLIRTTADFDNYRKRTRREGVEAEQRGREAFLKEILPVFDNLERAVSHAEVATDIQSLLNGIQMVKRQFSDTLARQGIERVPTTGAQFDPAIHEAIQHLETDDQPPGTVAHEIQGGYIAHKKLIRPALVVVAKAKSPANKEQGEDASKPAADQAAEPEQPGDEGEVTFDEPEIVDNTDAEDNRN
jgi:molecular chaperone GrpE